uniref:ORF47 protein n=1 Tax=Plutella xylostella granulovirus TaxID=98383 RepID=A0A7U3W5T0_9BBAC|nr:ORF47 protein [Plutella xylostella granulovirus]
MASPTPVDLINASAYVMERYRLNLIPKWRQRFPHILIDYSIKPADNELDYFVPPRLKDAVVVDLKFSREGCQAMSCYPFTETGVIDIDTPVGAYTQTSDTTIQYNQPACFNLDRAEAVREGEIQSVETRYVNHQCVMVDSFTKMYFNSPYLRTENHLIRGVDDVPGFNVYYDDDPAFPERIRGKYNSAYCRRFGRDAGEDSCTRPWYETFITFVLEESVFTTFKLLTTQVISDLRDFDYKKPSAILPDAPPPENNLQEWLRIRDSAYDPDEESKVLASVKNVSYTTNVGFHNRTVFGVESAVKARRRLLLGGGKAEPKRFYTNTLTHKNNFSADLEGIITDFLENHELISSILIDLGFSFLESTLTNMLQQVNKVLIPALKKVVASGTTKFTVRLLGETYKAAVIQVLNRTLINTVSVVARATTRLVTASLSVFNIAQYFFFIAEFVLMLWDPLGFNQMFPKGALDNLSDAFLSSYYESLGVDSREIIEIRPEHFTNFLNFKDDEMFEIILLSATYLVSLDVNSNGQVMMLDVGDEIVDFDESELVGAALAANDTFAYFKWYCTRHDALLVRPKRFMYISVVSLFVGFGASFFAKDNPTRCAIFLLILLSLLLLVLPSLTYYSRVLR